MSPVERTAAWVLNNGQYDEMEEEDGARSMEEGRNPEKVHTQYSDMMYVCVRERHLCSSPCSSRSTSWRSPV